jgi:periplasmic divalent cation tolerance protein
MTADILQVLTATGSRAEAESIARVLVERRLAACVQVVGPVASVYRWHGNIETAEEWLCLAKTRQSHYAAVEQAIRELHSYEVPEILAVPVVAGNAAYLRWLNGEMAPPGTAATEGDFNARSGPE